MSPPSSPLRTGFSRTFRAVWPFTALLNGREGGFTSKVVHTVPSRLLSFIPDGLEVSRLRPAHDHVTVEATVQRLARQCPDCGHSSRRLHSHYGRVLHDLPWQGRPATIRVAARRFRCLNTACSRKTFAERLGAVARRSARRTTRLSDLQRHVGLHSAVRPQQSWQRVWLSQPAPTRCSAWWRA